MLQQQQTLTENKESYLTQIQDTQAQVREYLTQWQEKVQKVQNKQENQIKDIQREIQDYLVSLLTDIPPEERKKEKKTIAKIEQALKSNDLKTYQQLLKDYDFLTQLEEDLKE